MGNFKIKTNGNNASEVIDMLILIGKKPITTKEGLLSEIAMGTNMIVDTGNGLFTTCGDYDVEELTLPELRDMVVLKRNDVNDATHESSIYKYFKACDDWYYFDLGCTDKWQKSAGAKPEYYEKLKPIEKKEMKEYLDQNRNYEFALSTEKDDGFIEIPEGAEILAETRNGLVFYKKHGDRFAYCFAGETEWGGTFTNPHDELGAFVSGFVWQHESEAKPPVDWSCVKENAQQIFDHENAGTPSLNDQYAEIEQVRQTLNERQSQYGSFKDVADTTAAFMDQFALGRMSNVQREALHMICSKLARIANGDPNHVDSWHDIAGYATLVVDDLES